MRSVGGAAGLQSPGPAQGALRAACLLTRDTGRDGLLAQKSGCRHRTWKPPLRLLLFFWSRPTRRLPGRCKMVMRGTGTSLLVPALGREGGSRGSGQLLTPTEAYCFQVPNEAHFQERIFRSVLLPPRTLLCAHCCVHARLILTPPARHLHAV